MRVLFNFIAEIPYSYRNPAPQTALEPAYELMDKSGDMKMENNPAYSVTGVQESSADHHYEAIPVNRHVKTKN